jgi:hypothetical protein
MFDRSWSGSDRGRCTDHQQLTFHPGPVRTRGDSVSSRQKLGADRSDRGKLVVSRMLAMLGQSTLDLSCSSKVWGNLSVPQHNEGKLYAKARRPLGNGDTIRHLEDRSAGVIVVAS